MVGGLDGHRGPTAETTLVVWRSLGVPASMGGCEGGECFCGGGFLSGMDFFGGQCGSWFKKTSAFEFYVVP
jgi:hypothetical protein